MRDPNQRLVSLKVTFFVFTLAVVGIALMVLGRYVTAENITGPLSYIPLDGIGSTLMVAGLIGVALDSLIKGDQLAVLERLLEKVLLRVMKSMAPTLRDSVIQAFADNINNLSVIATPEFLDQLARNALTLRLGDRDFAHDIYEDVRDQAILGSTERWRDATIKMNLSPLPPRGRERKALSRPPLFVLTARHEYTVVPNHAVRRFSAVSDEKHYEDLLDDSTSTSIWHVNPAIGIDASSTEAFELVQFSIDGQERPIRRTAKAGSQTYSVSIGADAVSEGKPVTLAYTYRTVVRQHGHMLHVETEQPTKGLDVQLEYGDCGIADMRLIPFIASSKKVRSYRLPPSVPERTVGIGFDGWCTKGQGVVAVWNLNSEVPTRAPSFAGSYKKGWHNM